MKQYRIQCEWDPEACVWVATSEDVPGLVLECGSMDALIERVKAAIPELIQLNGIRTSDVDLLFTSEKMERVGMYG